MRGLFMFGKELRAIIRNPKVLIPVLAVMLIPVLYSAMFLWAFYNPYGQLNEIPVAIVNEDKGAVHDDEHLTIGADLVEKLKEEQVFAWDFVDRKTAYDGIASNRYYMIIEIPEDFSERSTTLLEDHPQQLELIYVPNESLNFLASQIGETAVTKIKDSLSNTITQSYIETLYDKIATLPEGLHEASDAAGQLATGSGAARTGALSLQDGLSTLTTSTITFKNGLNDLAKGAADLNAGIGHIADGATGLSDGILQLQLGAVQLQGGAEQARAGIGQLRGGLDQSHAALLQTVEGSAALAQGIKQFAAAHPDLANDPALTAIINNSHTLSQGIKGISDAQAKLVEGATAVTAGQDQLTNGLAEFVDKMTDAKNGAVALSNGGKELLTGGKKLQAGATKLFDGSQQLADGADRLHTGSIDLGNGLVQIGDGASQLSTKLNEAANLTTITGNDEVYTMFADPVSLKVEKYHHVPNYGTGFAPYFMSLGLFVGALVLSIVVPLCEPAARPKSGISWYLGKFSLLALVGVLQAIIAAAIVHYVLRIDVENVPLYFIFAIITSLTYIATIQFLVTLFENPGRFVAILLLILQLTTSAGTFPLEVIPQALQWLNPLLPMTYSVAGFKAVISSGDIATMWTNVGVLLIFMAITMIGTWLFFIRMYSKHYKNMPISNA